MVVWLHLHVCFMSCSERLCEASTSKAPAHSRIKTCTKPRIAVSCSFACMSGPPGNSSSSSSNGFLEQLQGIASGTSHNLPILKAKQAKPKQRQSKSKTKAKRRPSENTARAMQRQSAKMAQYAQYESPNSLRQSSCTILGHVGAILGPSWDIF